MKFSEYPYERPEIEGLKAELEQLLKAIESADSLESLLEADAAYFKLQNHINTIYGIAGVRHTIDTTDAFYKEEDDFWNEFIPVLQEYINRHNQLLMESKYLEALKEVYPKPYFLMMEKQMRVFSPAIIEDLQLENKLASQYSQLLASAQIEYKGEILNLSQLRKYSQDLDRSVRKETVDLSWDFFKTHQATLDSIYDQLVKVRTKMAKTLGYNTFTEMAYDRMNRLDYDQEMVAKYREQVIKYVVPIATKLYKRQAKRIQVDALKYYDVNLSFLDGNAKPIGSFSDTLQSGKAMYEAMSQETGKFINFMMNNGLLDLEAKKGKAGGGYMTFFPDYKAPFIFSNFNGTSADVDVLTHEAGHAFQGLQSMWIPIPDCVMPTNEACEIHSMSMEFMAWPYMDKFFGDAADKYRYEHLSSSLMFLPYGVQVDHFQHEVYNNPTMTASQRRNLWRSLDRIYRPHLDMAENDFLNSGTYWFVQGHIFQSPFYYIDYTLAQVCAFQFWKRVNIEHDEKAWHDYVEICKVGGTKTFLEIVALAGIASPFIEETFRSTIGDIDSWLETVDDLAL